MSNVAINIAAQFTGQQAFNKAGKASQGLEKTIKKLGKTLGISLSTAAVVAYGKASLKAFSEDEKSAKRLALAVKSLGLQMSQPAIDNYISSLEKSSSIADDELRPAFQALLTTTGSLSKSQEILKLAIDGSRGSSESLSTVAQDLANAYIGNTKGLKKYNLGLTQTELKTMSFAKIQAKFNQQFGGASAEYLTTYAGKMDALKVSAGNAQETIGKGLVDALAILGGQGVDNIEAATGAMDDLASSTADVIRGQAVVLKNLAGLFDGKAGKVGNAIKVYFKEVLGIQALEDLGKDAMKPKAYLAGNMPQYRPYSPAQITKEEQARLKAERDAAKRAKELKIAQEKNTAELKKQAALKKAGSVFDMEQIQILAALRGEISESDRKRLEAQAAILNGNATLATQLTKDILMAQDKTGGLYQYFLSIGDAKIKNPFAFLDDWIVKFQEKMNSLRFPTPPQAATVPSNVNVFGAPVGTPFDPGWSQGGNMTPGASFPSTNVGTVPTGNFTYGAGNPLRTDVYIPPIELVISGDGDLTDAIAKNLQNKSLSNGKIADLERRTGFFL